MRILLVEDSVTDAGLTIRAIKNSVPECEIEHVTTMQEAKGLLAKKRTFDLAILDMQLPDGNGLDILMEIRQNHMDIAVAMLTGSGDEEVASAALKAGADDYMVKKPDYYSKIPQAVEFALENHRQSKQRESSIINVLYIEHDASDVDLTRHYLTRYAPYIRITNVQNAENALEMLPQKDTPPEEWKFQLILVDYRLPGMNALELIKVIRQERKLDIPILVVTGQGNEEVVVQALKLGASEYLVKRENYLNRLPSLITSAFQYCMLERKQKELAESESKYRLLAENSGDVIFTLDFDMNYTYISPAIYALRGYRPEEIINRNISETLTPASAKKVQQLMEKFIPAIRSGDGSAEPVVVELEARRKEGPAIWIEVKISVFIDSTGKPAGILGVSRDISKRKAAERELRKLSWAVTQSPVSITITDREGNIEYVNPQFTKLTGYTFEEVSGKNPRILKSGHQPDSYYNKMWETILSGKEWNGEFQNKKKNGKLYWVSANISALMNDSGKITHFVAVKEDITEKKKILDDLIEAKEKAEENDRLKSAFLANMSHEIRTPMNGILGFTSLLEDPQFGSEEKSEFMQSIHKSGQRMLDTVNDIVDISKIEAGDVRLSLTEFNVNEELGNCVEFFRQEAKKKGLEIHLHKTLSDEKAILKTDKIKFNSILTNLVKNAIKYTDEGRVECGYELKKAPDQVYLKFYVKDTGIGVPMNRQDAIFNRFEQADIDDTRAFQGSGLGLAISKSYVELLGGAIWVESEEGKGSAFYFTLPHEPPEMAKENTPKSRVESKGEIKESKGQKLNILIVEDEPDAMKFLSVILSNKAAVLWKAESGEDAVGIARQHPELDLILMDLKLPKMSGYEATKQIRQFNPQVPIIAQTAYALAGDRKKALDAGCNEYISKPMRKEQLLKLIQAVVGSYT